MNYTYIAQTLNEVGIKLFGYELVPPEISKKDLPVHKSPRGTIDLFTNTLDFEMVSSLYCYSFIDEDNDCPNCPWSKDGSCMETTEGDMIDRFNNWRSTDEIINAIVNMNITRSEIVMMLLTSYIDNTYDRPMLQYDDAKGYNIDEIFYFGHEILFDDSKMGDPILFEDVLALPFDLLDIDDIVIPTAEEVYPNDYA